MSESRGIGGQDPAERLAAALRRIAVGIERREAEHAAHPPAPPGTAELPVVAANLDALITRLRAVLHDIPPDDQRHGS